MEHLQNNIFALISKIFLALDEHIINSRESDNVYKYLLKVNVDPQNLFNVCPPADSLSVCDSI